MKKFIFIVLLCAPFVAFSQENNLGEKVMFYNCENFFDPIDDPATQDEEFTPTGRNGWTWNKSIAKRNGIAKTIIAVGNGNAPALVGLCEVENRLVLNQLVEQTPLAKIGYGIVHRESPDPRGIDVALLYRTDCFNVLHSQWHKVFFDAKNFHTREILYAKGVLHELDTLHIFVNHWPSKYGGAAKSEPRRVRAAETLRAVVDSIFATNPKANILVMGDFNDTPECNAITKSLGAVSDSVCTTCLHNLMLPLAKRGEGSLKYQKNWELIDMFFVSGNLLDTNEPIYCNPSEVEIFRADFLMEKDEKFLGDRPRRTIDGGRYKGGVSDHLPIVLTLKRGY